ncbi:hypothetical protein IWW36_000120 [Coemansia brasiliensis]|uniref:Increased recombination centers protein 6 n=1 Tax=Coemansia brasiliensis TaxID=2650707 RepID=A0A9W8M2Y3_9FUNG|nr:hypothetical protein IWW36_000120 [Coemansia brasiliensis]
MDPAVKNKILVLGRSEVQKIALVRSIIAGNTCINETTEDESAKIEWQLETRYFKAQLEFWIDNTEEASDTYKQHMEQWLSSSTEDTKFTDSIPMDKEMTELQEQLSDMVDAIVFVFDPSRPQTFAEIVPWARYAQTYEPNVLLCVALGDKAADEANADRWFDWCVANGWEWVDLTDKDPQTEYTVARIREALCTNEWDSMEAKSASSYSKQVASSKQKDDVNLQGLEREEWERFDEVAGSIDSRRVDNLHRMMFNEMTADNMSVLINQLHEQRKQLAQMDPEQARIKAAELAMAVTKHL